VAREEEEGKTLLTFYTNCKERRGGWPERSGDSAESGRGGEMVVHHEGHEETRRGENGG